MNWIILYCLVYLIFMCTIWLVGGTEDIDSLQMVAVCVALSAVISLLWLPIMLIWGGSYLVRSIKTY